MGDGEVAELLKIANGYLPRVRFEYDRVKNELNSWKAEISNASPNLSTILRPKSSIKK